MFLAQYKLESLHEILFCSFEITTISNHKTFNCSQWQRLCVCIAVNKYVKETNIFASKHLSI